MVKIILTALSNKIENLIDNNLISSNSKICFVDDGSRDDTWIKIKKHKDKNFFIDGIKLTKNFGHQNALLAGINYCVDKCDASISIDADLQQDIDAMDEFIFKYIEGSDVVYGVRNKRDTDTFFKKLTANLFYKLMKLLGTKTIKNHADYRLLSKRAMKILTEYKEVNIFIRGLIPTFGLKSDLVYFDVKERTAGESKYTITKMINLAIDGITSLSIKPIRIISVFGFLIFLFSLIELSYILLMYFNNKTISGWSSILFSIWAIGGAILLSIGVVGEYVGKMYMETKKRPRYIIEESLDY